MDTSDMGNYSHYWFGDDYNQYHDYTYDFYGLYEYPVLSEKQADDMHVYKVFSIICVVINAVLLLTAIAKSARSSPVYWYMYHVILVSLLQALLKVYHFSHHSQTGAFTHGLCVFIMVVDFALVPINVYNVCLMDIEIILAFIPKMPTAEGPIKRFLITINVTWITSIFFTVFILFFDEPLFLNQRHCYIGHNYNETLFIIKISIMELIPTAIMFICTFVGCGFYMRAKRHPDAQRFQSLSADRDNRDVKNELFVFFILWNFCGLLLMVLMFAPQFLSLVEEIQNIDIIAVVIAHGFIPCISLVLGSVRGVFINTVRSVVDFILGRNNVSPSSVSDVVALHPVQSY